MSTILFVHNHPARFVSLDLAELQKRYQVTELYLKSRLINPFKIWRKVRRHDLIFGWFASWHTFLPLEFACWLNKPSVLVIGGYDLARMPEIGYGHQRSGVMKWLSRRVMRNATCLITNSNYSHEEAVLNASLDSSRVNAIYHGVPDAFGTLPQSPRQRMVLTVGNIDRDNLQRKGHELFVRTAAMLPDVNFVLVGDWRDDAIEHLRSLASPNVTFPGFVTNEALLEYYRQAAVYVQASAHEGFGLSLAEAMLAGCVPVTSRAGALMEVAGNSGVYVDSLEPAALAQSIEKALSYSDEVRNGVRQRILNEFPLEKRGQLLEQVIAPLLTGLTDRPSRVL